MTTTYIPNSVPADWAAQYPTSPLADQPAVNPRRWSEPAPAAATAPTVPAVRLGVAIDQRRFWVGAALTAGVAALVGIIGLIVSEQIFHQQVLMALGSGPSGVHVGAYALSVAVIALLTALIYDGIAHFAPRPVLYFGWLGGLAVVLAAVLPFTLPVSLLSQAILAGINLLVGVAIVALIPAAAAAATNRRV